MKLSLLALLLVLPTTVLNAAPPAKGCKVESSINSVEAGSPDAARYVAIARCKERTEVYFAREAKVGEKADFLDPVASEDFPNHGRVIFKTIVVKIGKGLLLLPSGERGIYCSKVDDFSGKNPQTRVLMAVDLKKLVLHEYWTVDYKAQSITKVDGQKSECRLVDDV